MTHKKNNALSEKGYKVVTGHIINSEVFILVPYFWEGTFFFESTAYRLHIFSCKTSLIFHLYFTAGYILYNCVCDKLKILNVLYSQQETEPACRGCRWASAPPLEQVRYCSSPHASFPTAVSTECVRRNPHSCPWFTQLEQPKYWNANVRASVISQYLL